MISIIIVNYNVKDYLSQCIDSINKSVIDEQFEIIIVDNNSSEYYIIILANIIVKRNGVDKN